MSNENVSMFETMVAEILNQAQQDVREDGGDMFVDLAEFAAKNDMTIEQAEYHLYHEVLPTLVEQEIEPELDEQYFGPEGKVNDHIDRGLVALMEAQQEKLETALRLTKRAKAHKEYVEWKSLQHDFNKLGQGYKPRTMQAISPFNGRVETITRWESPTMQVDLNDLNKRLKVEASRAFERGEKVLAKTIATKRKAVVGQTFLAVEEKFWSLYNTTKVVKYHGKDVESKVVQEANKRVKQAWAEWREAKDTVQEKVKELGGWYQAWYGPLACITNGNRWNTNSGDSNQQKDWAVQVLRNEELEAALRKDRKEEKRMEAGVYEALEYASTKPMTQAEKEERKLAIEAFLKSA